MLEKIKAWTAAHEEEIINTYRHLHSIAEVSWKEVNTTNYLCKQLETMGIPYTAFDDQTGVIGIWGNKEDGPTAAIRADMDALWQIVNGEWKANHSCGHDAHMTMVLHTVKCLKEIGFEPKGQLKIIFQPAEETGKGALSLVEKGVIEDMDYMLGIHVRPFQELSAEQAAPAIYHGATTLLRGKIHGVQAHGARPHLGVNAVDSLGSIIAAVNAVKLDPALSYSAKVTTVKAGGDNVNIIPDYAEFGIDLRAQTNEAMEELIRKVEIAAVQAGSMNGARVETEIAAKMVAAIPNAYMEEIVSEAIQETMGPDALSMPAETPGGEDFHFYCKAYPHLKATVVGLGTGLKPGLHHPDMSFDLKSMQNGVAILSRSITKLL